MAHKNSPWTQLSERGVAGSADNFCSSARVKNHCIAIDGPPCWNVISAVTALYAAVDGLSTSVAVTRVAPYSCIWQLSLPRAVVSRMTFLSVAVTVRTGTYTMLRWARPP